MCLAHPRVRIPVGALGAPDAVAQERSFTALRTLLAVHETAEEMMVHLRVRRKLTAAVQAAERIAPTHPHPGVESAVANFAVGPFAAVLDRARDAPTR